MRKIKVKKEPIIKDDKLKQLEKEIIYLKAENEYLKKIEFYSSRKEAKTNEKVKVVAKLRVIYSFKILLKITSLAKSVYYYHMNKKDKDDKNVDDKSNRKNI